MSGLTAATRIYFYRGVCNRIFQECERGESVIFVPSIVIAETLSIFDKKRVVFDFKKLFAKIAKSENYVIISLDLTILEKMIDLRKRGGKGGHFPYFASASDQPVLSAALVWAMLPDNEKSSSLGGKR